MTDENKIHILDARAKAAITLSSSDIKPGMILAHVKGEDEPRWIAPDMIRSSQTRHPPFEDEMRERIIRLKRKLSPVRPISYKMWEDEFRRDTDPEQEIEIWEAIADIFARHGRTKGKKFQAELYRLLFTCSMTTEDHVKLTFPATSIPPHIVAEILNEFYQS
ncbi:MAG: hypothetical protein KDN22_25495 [Verrucomicrobiae bacterium]|nr:hypothetical protein [Verrucomicrobiae bacterium]